MAMTLNGKVALVTGASSGIGSACARAFATAGAAVIVAARRTERLTALAEELRTLGAKDVLCIQLDVRDASAVQAAITGLPTGWQDIDILVNNAGLGRGLDKLQQGDVREWDEMIDTNIKGLLYVTRAVLPGMVARDCGHVVQIGSIAGQKSYPGGGVYCATKAAVRMLNDCLKHDLLGTAIRVSSVDPGMVETEFSQVRFRGDAERAHKVYQGVTPMTPDDVADAVLYCVTRPAHVNISELVMLATDQASPSSVHRRS